MALVPEKWMAPFRNGDHRTYHVRIVNGGATASGEKSSEARQLVRNHEQPGTAAPSANGRLPPVLAHQLASAHKSLIFPTGSPDSVTY